MRTDSRRITLLTRPVASARPWDISGTAPSRMVLVDAFSMLPFVLDHANQDVDRILVDETASPIDFMELISSLPQQFVGDVLYMRTGGNSFLSAIGRSGCRILYTLAETDVNFYLQTFRLVAA